MVITSLLLVVVASPGSSGRARAQTGLEVGLKLVGQLGGGSPSVAVAGDQAYLALGSRVQVLELADPSRIRAVGLYLAGKPVVSVAAGGRLAFVLDQAGTLHVLDVASPAQPLLVGTLDGFGPDPSTVFLDGDRVFLGTGEGWLVALDLSDPRQPRELSRVEVGRVRQAAVSDGLAYLAAGAAGLVAVDLRDPSAMRVLGRLNAGEVNGLAVAADVGYIGACQGPQEIFETMRCGLVVVDLRDPSALVATYRLELPNEWFGPMRLAGARLAMLGGLIDRPPPSSYSDYSHLRLFDLATPTAPAAADAVGGIEGSWLAGTDERLFVAEKGGGLRSLDLSGTGKPSSAALWRAPVNARSVASADGYAYVGDHALGGLWVVDIRKPEAAVPVGFAPGGENYFCGADCALVHAKGYVYAADSNNGLMVFDIRRPDAPRMVASLDIRGQGNWMDVAVADDHAFFNVDEGRDTGRPSGGIFVLDILPPWRQPLPIAHVDGFEPFHIAMAEPHLLLATDLEGWLRVIDVADPSQPRILAELVLGSGRGDLVARDSFAYVAGRDGALSIVDIRQPAAPKLVGQLPASPARRLEASISILRSWMLLGGLRLVDVSRPDRPIVIDEKSVDAWPFAAAVDLTESDGLFIAAAGVRGLTFSRPERRSLPIQLFLPRADP
ncbi:MAG: LVIVD repeat-containing protein [Anaerolineae bacterium]